MKLLTHEEARALITQPGTRQGGGMHDMRDGFTTWFHLADGATIAVRSRRTGEIVYEHETADEQQQREAQQRIDNAKRNAEMNAAIARANSHLASDQPWSTRTPFNFGAYTAADFADPK